MKKYAQILGLVAVSIPILGVLWAAADYTGVRPILKKELASIVETQQQLSENVLLLRFQILMSKNEKGVLTFDERQELCLIVRQLNYVGVEVCSQ